MHPSPRIIKAARVALGWSQAELAEQAQVSPNALYRLEAGATDPRQSTVDAIVTALEGGGIQFLAPDERHGPGLRLRNREPAATNRLGKSARTRFD